MVCLGCQPRERDRLPLSAPALETLRRFGESGEAWRQGWDARVGAEVRQVLGLYVTCILGRRPRLLPYLGS